MSAVFSPCGTYRYRLDRVIRPRGLVYAFFGVNGATATAEKNDHTVSKWTGFTTQEGGSRFIVGNPFAYCAVDVNDLARADDPIGPENAAYLAQIIAEADILVPCWGRTTKVPLRLRQEFNILESAIRATGKPVLHFGLTQCGSPKHPLTLGYDVALTPWNRA